MLYENNPKKMSIPKKKCIYQFDTLYYFHKTHENVQLDKLLKKIIVHKLIVNTKRKKKQVGTLYNSQEAHAYLKFWKISNITRPLEIFELFFI